MAGEKLGESQDPNSYVNVESISSLKDDDTDIASLKLPSDPMFSPHDDHVSNQHVTELREQDRWLPINNVARLMKNTLPVSAKVSKDAKECMQECVSEFISFVTSEASDRCAADKRKTINGEDILISLHALGFENYAEVLKIYLAKYRQYQAIRNQQLLEEEATEEPTAEPNRPENTENSNESVVDSNNDNVETEKWDSKQEKEEVQAKEQSSK
ncbi:transcriptional activator Hap3p [Monosporozyma unispora]|nr:hypothetical protein C6P44_004782 [Kazachstania unispora]